LGLASLFYRMILDRLFHAFPPLYTVKSRGHASRQFPLKNSALSPGLATCGRGSGGSSRRARISRMDSLCWRSSSPGSSRRCDAARQLHGPAAQPEGGKRFHHAVPPPRPVEDQGAVHEEDLHTFYLSTDACVPTDAKGSIYVFLRGVLGCLCGSCSRCRRHVRSPYASRTLRLALSRQPRGPM
jgi:hypothetical protein